MCTRNTYQQLTGCAMLSVQDNDWDDEIEDFETDDEEDPLKDLFKD